MFETLRNPDLYHGHYKSRNFFEGWYYKIIDPTSQYIYAIIPGVFFGNTTDDSHSFIQILDGRTKQFSFIKYPANSFSAESKEFLIHIKDSYFSLDALHISSHTSALSAEGSLQFHNHKKWPDSILHPGSMGAYNYLSFMECYSQVCAMDATISGSLTMNGKKINFNGGKLYIEKNWGRQFPKGWIWIQSNHFDTVQAALSCSIGHIPFIYKTFRGFLIGLWVEGTFHQFTTMNKSTLEIKQHGTDLVLRVKNRTHILLVKTKTKKENFILCHGPDGNNMTPFVQENLTGNCKVILKERYGKRVVFSDIGKCTGIEYGGNQMLVI